LLLSVCCIAISIGFNYFFTAQWGARGAALANVSTYSVALLFTLLFTQKYWRQFLKSTKQ
jgi:Na+-driven multidrug efflux pump